METFAGRLRAKREEQGLTQEELALAAGVGQATIAKIEAGKTRDSRRIIEIAEALGVSPKWLRCMSDDQDPNPPPPGSPLGSIPHVIGADAVGRGQRLASRRSDLAMTQVQLAAASDCSQQLVAALEIGRIKWSRKLLDIAKALDVDIVWLESGGDAPPALTPVAGLSDREAALIRRFRESSEADRLLMEQAQGADFSAPPPVD